MEQISDVKQSTRRDWLPELILGLVAVMFCRLWNTVFGGLYSPSNSKQIVFAVVGALALAKAAYGVRRADGWTKSMCGVSIVFGTLMLVVDCISIANP